jgi:eukaryotic-like serine/threonine-protein kinase
MGSLFPAWKIVQKLFLRIRPGFFLQKCLPEVDQLRAARKGSRLDVKWSFRFHLPGTKLSGAYVPSARSTKEYKRHVLYEAGHDIPRNELVKESLKWLHRYLGPVK